MFITHSKTQRNIMIITIITSNIIIVQLLVTCVGFAMACLIDVQTLSLVLYAVHAIAKRLVCTHRRHFGGPK